MRPRWVLLVAGLVALLLVLGGFALARRGPDASPAGVSQDAPGPVLLVAGYGGNRGVLRPLRHALVEQGRDVVVVPVRGHNKGDLRVQAASLGRAATRAMVRAGAESVDVVGFSAGGVVARLWVREHGGDQVARRVLTIGSPHHGARLASLAIGLDVCPPACRQLAPSSSLLERLNSGDETPDGPRWVSVWSTADQIASPPRTARLEGALEVTVQQVCPDRRTAHRALPGDPVVLALLDTALGADAPAVPADVDCRAP